MRRIRPVLRSCSARHVSAIFFVWLWQKLSFDDDNSIDDVTGVEPDVISDRLLAYKLRQATMLGHLTDYRRRIDDLDVMVSLCIFFVFLFYVFCFMQRWYTLYYRSQWPWPLDLKFAPLVPTVQRYVFTKLQCRSFTAFLFQETRRHKTDWRTGKALNAAP